MLKLTDPTLLRSKCYINGQWSDAKNGETLPVTNPATGEVITEVPLCGAEETESAIEAAAVAQKAWAATTAKERAVVLRRQRS